MHLARNGVDPTETHRRKVVIVGTRTLYLQALCEILNARAELFVSLTSPVRLRESRLDHSPELVLLDCAVIEDATEELEQLMVEVRRVYQGVSVLLLTSKTARESAKQAAKLHADGWASMSLPVAELVRVLSDRGEGASDGRTTFSGGPRYSGPAPDWPLSALSERELSVLRLVVDGASPDEIASMLGISRHTVRTHLQNVMAKMVVRSRTEMVTVARRSGVGTTPGTHQS